MRPVGKWSTILGNVGFSVLSEVSKKGTHSRIKVFAALGEVYVCHTTSLAHKHTQTYTHKHTQKRTHKNKHKHKYTQTHTNTNTHKQTHKHKYAQTRTHTHKHTHTHTHRHHNQLQLLSLPFAIYNNRNNYVSFVKCNC